MFSPTTLGEFRFGYAYRRVELPTERGFEAFPTVIVAGFGTLGSQSVQYPISRRLYDVQGAGSIAHSRGRHAYKAGYDVHRTFNNGIQSDNARGTISFGVGYGRRGIENFLAGTPTSYTLTVGDPRRNFRVWDLGVFAQDDVRLRSNLTLNLGIRFESLTEWKEKDGLTTFGYGGQLFKPAPRVGAVSDVRGDGVWVLRGAYGLSYDRVNFFFLRSLQFQEPQIRTITLLPTAQPLRVEALGPNAGQVQSGPVSKSEVDPDFHFGRVHTWNATVERRIGRSSSVRASYVGTASRDVPATLILNRAVPAADATFANRQARRPNRRVAAGLQFQLSYTLSEALDMASDPGFGSGDNYLSMDERADRTFVADRAAGMAIRRADLYGPSRFDMRHVGSLNGSYQLPRPPSASRSPAPARSRATASATTMRSRWTSRSFGPFRHSAGSARRYGWRSSTCSATTARGRRACRSRCPTTSAASSGPTATGAGSSACGTTGNGDDGGNGNHTEERSNRVEQLRRMCLSYGG